MFEDLAELSTADLLESAAEHRAEINRREVRLLGHALVYADRYRLGAGEMRPGQERAVVLGGDGCPAIAEFAPVEFGVVLGISAGAAAAYIGQALALRHRFPLIWAKVLAGEATPWRARKIAEACRELSAEAAASVDRRLARCVDTVTPQRLENIVEATKKHADPEGARKKAEEKARERGVYVGRSDEHGTQKVFIRAPSGHVRRFNATVASIAEALKIFGDTRSLQHRRADAVGIIADPRYTEELLLQARNEITRRATTPPDDSTAPTTDETTAATPTDHSAAATTTDEAAANAATSTAATTAATTAASAATGAAASTAAGDAIPATRIVDDAWGNERSVARRDVRSDDEELAGDWMDRAEPGPYDEADRDAPHPSETDLPDPLDDPSREQVEPFDSGLRIDLDDGEPLDSDSLRALNARLAQIRRDAHTCSTGTTSDQARPGQGRPGQARPGQTEIYVHLTDHTLATGTGVLRAEGFGPLLASQLSELIGHGPYTVKPVIDLNDAVSVDAYEIPDRIRERVKLIHPVELFPYGTHTTTRTTDLDHIQPYDPLGPPGQTSVDNLAPLRRFSHRVKTHGRGWRVRRIDRTTLEWSTPNGFTTRVDPTGTQRARRGNT